MPSLQALTGSYNFANRSTLTIQRRNSTDDSTVATSASRASLSIQFNADTGTLRPLGSNGQTVSFTGTDIAGSSVDTDYFKQANGQNQYLTIINPSLGGGTKYVSGGLWQRLKSTGTRDDFEFGHFCLRVSHHGRRKAGKRYRDV